MDVPVAANVLGTVGAVCWSVQVPPLCWLCLSSPSNLLSPISPHFFIMDFAKTFAAYSTDHNQL
jgi:hypothetical protein